MPPLDLTGLHLLLNRLEVHGEREQLLAKDKQMAHEKEVSMQLAVATTLVLPAPYPCRALEKRLNAGCHAAPRQILHQCQYQYPYRSYKTNVTVTRLVHV